MQCFQVAWKRHSVFYDTKCPTPSPNPTPLQVLTHMTVLLGFLHSHHSLAPKTCGWSFFSFFFFAWIYGFVVNIIFHLNIKISRPSSVILSKLSLGSWRVQVRFAASGSTGRMSPSRQWSWTSPLARGSSGPRISWTASYKRSTPSLSKPMTVERVLMVPTWRNLTSESNSAS